MSQAMAQQANIANQLRAQDMQREAQEQSNLVSAGTMLADAALSSGAGAAGAGAAGAGAAGAGAAGAGAAGAGAAGAGGMSGMLAAMGPIGWAGLAALAIGALS